MTHTCPSSVTLCLEMGSAILSCLQAPANEPSGAQMSALPVIKPLCEGTAHGTSWFLAPSFRGKAI